MKQAVNHTKIFSMVYIFISSQIICYIVVLKVVVGKNKFVVDSLVHCTYWSTVLIGPLYLLIKGFLIVHGRCRTITSAILKVTTILS